MGEVYGDITAIRYEYFTVDPGTFKGGCPDSVLESSHLPRKRRMVLDRIMCASDLFRENTQNRSDSGTLAAVRVSDHKSADKNAVARPRPFDTYTQIIPLITRPKDYSFPSGHTCASFAVALVCLRMLPGKWGILPVVLAGMIAFSRLYLGVHYPGDVLAGFLVALLTSTVACRLMRRTFHLRKADRFRRKLPGGNTKKIYKNQQKNIRM